MRSVGRGVALAFASFLACVVGTPGCDAFTAGPDKVADAGAEGRADTAAFVCPDAATLCDSLDVSTNLDPNWSTHVLVGSVGVAADNEAPSLPNALLATTEPGAEVQASISRTYELATTTDLELEASLRVESIADKIDAQIVWFDRTGTTSFRQEGAQLTKDGVRAFVYESDLDRLTVGTPHPAPRSGYWRVRVRSVDRVTSNVFHVEIVVDGAVVSSVDAPRSATPFTTRSVTANVGLYGKAAGAPHRARFDDIVFVAR